MSNRIPANPLPSDNRSAGEQPASKPRSRCGMMRVIFSFQTRSLMRALIPVFLLALILAAASCTGSDDQREFEEQAFLAPEGYTETDASGNLIDGGEFDPDDWRVAPFFQGLIEVDPAFPNPVLTTDQVTLQVLITGVESINGLGIYAWFHETGGIRPIDLISQSPVPPGLHTFRFQAAELSRFDDVESARGLKRLLLLDNNENVISYGDILVE